MAPSIPNIYLLIQLLTVQKMGDEKIHSLFLSDLDGHQLDRYQILCCNQMLHRVVFKGMSQSLGLQEEGGS